MGSQLERDEPSIIVWLDGACTPPRSIRRHRAGAPPFCGTRGPGYAHVESYRGAAFVRHYSRSEFVAQCSMAARLNEPGEIALRGRTFHNGQSTYIFLTTFTDRTYLA